MKTLRKITAATILCLMLSVCVFAGQIQSNGVVEPPPPPPPPTATAQTTSTATAILLMVLTLISR